MLGEQSHKKNLRFKNDIATNEWLTSVKYCRYENYKHKIKKEINNIIQC